jgi:hypothetical protein
MDGPVLRFSFAEWFDMAPFERIDVAVEAGMATGGARETMRLSFVPSPGEAHVYRLEDEGDVLAFSGWLSRVDPGRSMHVDFAVSGDNPASYAVRDGQISHFNDSLRKQLSIDTVDGPAVLFSSDSTLAWEIKHYLRAAVTCLDAQAFAGAEEEVRDSLYGRIDTIDLLIKAADLQGAMASAAEVERRVAAIGLAIDHAHTQRLARVFGDVRRLLASVSGAGGPVRR